MRILHENPEVACAKMSSFAQFMTIECGHSIVCVHHVTVYGKAVNCNEESVETD